MGKKSLVLLGVLSILSTIFLGASSAQAVDAPSVSISVESYPVERAGDSLRMNDILLIWPDSGTLADFQPGGKFENMDYSMMFIFNAKDCGKTGNYLDRSSIPWRFRLPAVGDCTLGDPFDKGGQIKMVVIKRYFVGSVQLRQQTEVTLGLAKPALVGSSLTGGTTGSRIPGQVINICAGSQTTNDYRYAFYRDGVLQQVDQCVYTVREQDSGSTIRGSRVNLSVATYASGFWKVAPLSDFTVKPAISLDGLGAQGTQMSCVLVGDWLPKPSAISMQFTLNGVNVGSPAVLSATQKSAVLTVTSSMAGKSLSCTAKAELQGYRASELVSLGREISGFGVSSPIIEGSGLVGATLSAKISGWGVETQFTYQWLRDAVVLPSATNSNYQVVPADLNHLISVRVTGLLPGLPAATRTSLPVNILKSSTGSPSPSAAPVTSQPTVLPTARPTLAPTITPSQLPQVAIGSALTKITGDPTKATKALISSLESKEVASMTPSILAQIPSEVLSAMTVTQVKAVTPSQIVALPKKKLASIAPKFISAVSPGALKALSAGALKSLTLSQRKAVTISQLKVLSRAQRLALGR